MRGLSFSRKLAAFCSVRDSDARLPDDDEALDRFPAEVDFFTVSSCGDLLLLLSLSRGSVGRLLNLSVPLEEVESKSGECETSPPPPSPRAAVVVVVVVVGVVGFALFI
jgi:hypothetical protein